jgi:hypothetical protein
VATRAQVLALLEGGHSYESAARALGIPAGLAFMIATGAAADGSEAPPREALQAERLAVGTPQDLVNPRSADPIRNEHVLKWVRGRARRELGQPR